MSNATVDDGHRYADNRRRDTTRRQYNMKVARAGQFESYEAFKTWIEEYYAPPDFILSYRDKYETIKQDQNESVHHFYLRFTEIVDKLDEEPSQSWQASHFLNRLHHDTTKYLGSLCDIKDFKKITLDDIYQRIVRTIRLGGRNDGGNKNGGNWIGKGKHAEGTSNRQDHTTSGHGVSEKSKPKFKRTGDSAKKLTAEQKQRVERLMNKGGGEFVGKSIRNNEEWYSISKENNVCRNCAGKRHFAQNCPLKRAGDLVDTSDSDVRQAIVNSNDRDYLCSLGEDDNIPLAMFPCTVDGGSHGIALCDYGATRNFVSLAYAKQAQLKMRSV